MKIWLHKRGEGEKFGEAELVANTKDFPDAEVGSLYEISGVGESHAGPLLLQLTHIFHDFNQKDTMSIEQGVAGAFGFRSYGDVSVRAVEKEGLALDSLELTFKEQYISRADMWRMRKRLLHTANYTNKKVELFGIRCEMKELWRKGDEVSCGYVNEATRIVFRSSSSLMYIFIQMSQEMWEFHNQGDLYLEKCVHGFLPDLFEKWKEKNCSHYVSVILFSRWHCVGTEEDIPPDLRSRLFRDPKGRLSQDFYRLLVQNEHYEDWLPLMSKLKLAFAQYRDSIRQFHQQFQYKSGWVENSTARDGNFLETLNVALNLFSKHHVDRAFERTGQQIVLITPGGGVFNVDRGLAALTKQRVIDTGVSIDMVCLGEQPLHAVPLFVYLNRQRASRPSIADYFIPHWMNHSYYNMARYPSTCCTFKPRIKIPESVLKSSKPGLYFKNETPTDNGDPFSYPDFDEYDRTAFSSLLIKTTSPTHKKTYDLPQGDTHTPPPRPHPKDQETTPQHTSSRKCWSKGVDIPASSVRRENEPHTVSGEMKEHVSAGGALRPGSLDQGPHWRLGGVDGKDESSWHTPQSGGLGKERRGLSRPFINPFRPSEFSIKISSNRRRWIHVFPVDAKGMARSPHHAVVCGSSQEYALKEPEGGKDSRPSSVVGGVRSLRSPARTPTSLITSPKSKLPPVLDLLTPTSRNSADAKKFVWAWGPTGEEKWNPDMEIGTDWKSMIRPALLPTTTDFFPDSRSLKEHYLLGDHPVLLDDSLRDAWTDSPSADFRFDIFEELVAQRLQKGFQIIILSKDFLSSAVASVCRDPPSEKECYMSINRIYHRISLRGDEINVKKFLPRHKYPLTPTNYQYEFQVPDSGGYDQSTTRFHHEPLYKFNWSAFDNFVANLGEGEVEMGQDALKAWHARCDIYDCEGSLDPRKLTEGFLKFMEVLNKIRRPSHPKKSPEQTSFPSPICQDGETELGSRVPSLIIAGMLSSERGLQFLPPTPDKRILVEKAFVSAELVHWLIFNVVDIDTPEQAVAFSQRLLDQGKICHISGDWSHKFVYGFFLYFVVLPPQSGREEALAQKRNSNWMEVEIWNESCPPLTQDQDCEYGLKGPESNYVTSQIYTRPQTVGLDFEPQKRTGRKEWGQMSFGAKFCPHKAYQLRVEWLVATGATVADLVHSSWWRRAPTCEFQLIPVPVDPFALPHNPNSDPLRCPVYIPLEMEPPIPPHSLNRDFNF